LSKACLLAAWREWQIVLRKAINKNFYAIEKYENETALHEVHVVMNSRKLCSANTASELEIGVRHHEQECVRRAKHVAQVLQ
jgi:hypothetical protein